MNAQEPATTWRRIQPRFWEQTGRLAHPRLAEVSGVAKGSEAEVYWVINDSGNRPDLYAIDSTGSLLATIPLAGVTNTDWEELASGPCGDITCLYIADTGDNRERRNEVAVHRLPEPAVPAAGEAVKPLEVETLRVRYPVGSHDVEAMGVLPDGSLLLITKGRSQGILMYRLAADAWDADGASTASRVDSLPIAASLGTGRVVTGLAISPDGTRMMVRTYRDLFPFAIAPDFTLRPLGGPTYCDILGYEPQGEAIAWMDERRLILLSERGLFKEGTVFIAECRP